MLRTATSLAALTLVTALALTGCAAEQAPAQSDARTTSTPSPTPEEIAYAAGDVVDAAAAEAINADTSDLTVAYPVGDEFVVVTWGEPIAESVIKQVDANVNGAVVGEYGSATNGDLSAEHFYALRDLVKAESAKLGGIEVQTLRCELSYSDAARSYLPTWIYSEQLFNSYGEAKTVAEEWAQARVGKGLYITINKIGCAQ